MKTICTSLVFAAAMLVPGIAGAQQLPFSGASPTRPTISPYLGLLNASNPGVSNYHQFVRPQLQQREDMLRQQAQIAQVQRQVQRGQPGGVPVRGSPDIRATGHETVYMNYLHFYPGARR